MLKRCGLDVLGLRFPSVSFRMMRCVIALVVLGSAIAVTKDEYLVSGIKSASPHPFGLSPDVIEGIPHDKCAVSIPVPGNDDSMTLVTLGVNRAIWIKRYNGEEWGDWISLNGTASSGPSALKCASFVSQNFQFAV